MSDKKINVLYVLTKLELGGAQKVCLSLFDGVNKSGSFAALISGNEGVLLDKVKHLDSVFVIDSFKREVGIKNIFKEFKTFFQLIKHIKKVKKNNEDLIVHTHSTKAGILGRWAAFFAGVKKRVHTVHGFGFNDYQPRVVWFLIYLSELTTSFITTKYVCVSKKDLNLGKKILPNFYKKSVIIRAAVQWDKFYIPAKKTEFDPSDKFVIGTVSCFKPQKNLFDLLKAFKFVYESLDESRKQQILLQIIGDGQQREKIEGWIKENNLEDKVELLGWQNDVSLFMKSWSLFVMSSLWEGLPCAVVEARLSKLPVIAYDVGGIYEVLDDGQNGFLIEPGDWKTLAKKIGLVVKDNNLHKSMSLHSDDLLDFKNSVMVQKHLDFYGRL